MLSHQMLGVANMIEPEDTMRIHAKLAAILTLFAVAIATASATAQDATRSITKIAGDVYRFQNNFHFNVFVITGEGVVVTDPINAEAAAWLKAEIAGMTDQPITHLIYSHSHGDHASGGAVLAETATVIAAETAPADIDGVVPDIRFSERMTLALGGKTFELTALGPGHGTDLIAMVVRPENVVFAVDAVSAKRLPFRDFPGADVAGIIEQISRVEALEFDILAPGHGDMGVKSDATDHRLYVEHLMQAVKTGLEAGESVDALVASLTLDEYAGWGAFEQFREPNIRGMARWLQETGMVKN